MTSQQPKFLEVNGAAPRRIAYLHAEPATPGAPGLLWLIGLKSDMHSTKVAALAEWAAQQGLGMTRFDYSGHGQSSGAFEAATVSDWLEEAYAVYHRITKGPQIIVGSSTGGHIALLLLRRLQAKGGVEDERLKGVVLIAPAWDLTEELLWKTFPDEVRREIMAKGSYTLPSDYDASGYVITRAFIEDGRKHLLARKPFDPGRPVAILQGLQDTDVPPEHARELLSFMTGKQVSVTEVPDAGHRLSRPEDLALLYGLIETQLARIGS